MALIFGSKMWHTDAYMQQTTLMVQQSQTAAAHCANRTTMIGWVGNRKVLQASPAPPSSTVNDKVNDDKR
jgi:hypothetical protein